MKLIQKLSWLASAAGLALTAHAVPTQYLTGTIDFSFSAGAVTPVNSGGTATSIGTATGFDFNPNSPTNNATVSASTGVLGSAIAVGQQVSFSDFQFNPLGPSSPTLIWTHSGTGISFSMTSVSNITQASNILQVTGTGILSDGGSAYANSPGTFTIFGSGTGSSFSFTSASSSGSAVPDGANLLVLVGSAMAGLVGIRRFRVKA